MIMNLSSVKKMAIKSNKKNPMAKELFTKKFKPKIVKAKKGKGSFTRKKNKLKVLHQFVVLLLMTFRSLFLSILLLLVRSCTHEENLQQINHLRL